MKIVVDRWVKDACRCDDQEESGDWLNRRSRGCQAISATLEPQPSSRTSKEHHLIDIVYIIMLVSRIPFFGAGAVAGAAGTVSRASRAVKSSAMNRSSSSPLLFVTRLASC